MDTGLRGAWMLYVVVVLVLILLCIPLLFWWQALFEASRSKKIEAFANSEFDRFEIEPSISELPSGIDLLSGRSPRLFNMFTGEREGVRLKVFDFHCTQGKNICGQSGNFHVDGKDDQAERKKHFEGKAKSAYSMGLSDTKRTVVCIKGLDSIFPSLQIKPKAFLDNFGMKGETGEVFSFPDLPDHVVSGEDKGLVLGLINREIVEFVREVKAVSIEISGQTLVVCSTKRRVVPERYEELVENSLHFLFLFQASLQAQKEQIN